MPVNSTVDTSFAGGDTQQQSSPLPEPVNLAKVVHAPVEKERPGWAALNEYLTHQAEVQVSQPDKVIY